MDEHARRARWDRSWRQASLIRRWFRVGVGVKRWLVLLGLGAAVAGMGLVYLILLLNRLNLFPEALYRLVTLQFLPPWWRTVVPLLLGGAVIVLATVRLGAALLAPFRHSGESLADELFSFGQRSRGPHIVAIGGGSGLPSLLRGLKSYTTNITTVVTMADDGGSSGRLRRDLGLLPPGDLRNNLAALARDEALMTRLLQYRFGDNLAGEGGSDLRGHAFGNLLLAALTGITGGFAEALLAAERVLAVQGRVLPSTLDPVTLAAELVAGDPPVARRVVGESAIPAAQGVIQRVYLEPAGARAYPPVLKAIFQADLIVLGPGSLFTSIVPNLLVSDLAQALAQARAPRVYVCNLATQPGETDNYTVADHVATVSRYLPPYTLNLVIANDNLSLPPDTGDGQTIFVSPRPAPVGVEMRLADLVDRHKPWRHDSGRLARAVMDVLGNG